MPPTASRNPATGPGKGHSPELRPQPVAQHAAGGIGQEIAQAGVAAGDDTELEDFHRERSQRHDHQRPPPGPGEQAQANTEGNEEQDIEPHVHHAEIAANQAPDIGVRGGLGLFGLGRRVAAAIAASARMVMTQPNLCRGFNAKSSLQDED
jgi:hypothetical protein